MKAVIISLVQAKGGVAKTTSAVNLACSFANMGYKVALLDFDHQNHCSLFFDIRYNVASSVDFFHTDKSLLDCLQRTQIENLFIMSSSMELSFRESGVDLYLARTKLIDVRSSFDIIIIDNNPSMNIYVKNAIFASDHLLIPLVPSPLSSEGFQTLLKELNVFISQHDLAVSILGIFFTIVESNLSVSRYFRDELIKEYGELVLNSFIRKDVRMLESPALSLDIFSYKSNSRSALDYLSLRDELLAKLSL